MISASQMSKQLKLVGFQITSELKCHESTNIHQLSLCDKMRTCVLIVVNVNISQGWFYAANWQILANFEPNFVTPEISVNQVKNLLAYMWGVES